MFSGLVRRRSLGVYHLHMGGPDGDAVACGSLRARRYEAKLREVGARFVRHAGEADVMLLTGVLLGRNLDAVLREIASLPQPSCVVAVGDCAINGGRWAQLEMPGLVGYSIGHYVDVQYRVVGDPVTPEEVIEALRIVGNS